MVKLQIEEEEPSVTIRLVIPSIMRSKKEKTQLEEDLREIGCHGFMKLPWNLRDKGMVRELMGEQSSEFSLTVRAKLDDWSPETWRAVYHFPKGGKGNVSRSDKLYTDISHILV